MNELEVLQQSILNPMTALWTKVVGYIPNFISAIVIIVAGYFIARFVRFVLAKFLGRIGVDKLSAEAGLANILDHIGVTYQASQLVSVVGFWLIMLTFMVSAADALGLPRVSATIDDFVLYLPKVVGAAFVVLVGLFVAKFIRNAVQGLGESMNLGYAHGLGLAVYSLLVVVVVSLAIGQLEIETELLNLAVSILLLSMGAAVALSLGLGTREIAANIIAGVYARELFKPGSSIEIDAVKGKVVEVGTAKTIIKGSSKTYYLSNRELIDKMVQQPAARKTSVKVEASED